MIDDWRDIIGFHGKYQVNYEGNIRRVYKSGKTRLMTPYFKHKSDGGKQYVVKLTINGKSKEVVVHQIVALAYLGKPPKGYVPYHINGCHTDNYASNIAYISRQELGKKTGANSRKKSVAKINQQGEIVEFYSSARECARNNYMSHQTVIDRCNGKRKSAFAPDGYAYAWEDSEVSMRKAIRKIEIAIPTIQKAPQIEYQW